MNTYSISWFKFVNNNNNNNNLYITLILMYKCAGHVKNILN